jgi:hypothetical protein
MPIWCRVCCRPFLRAAGVRQEFLVSEPALIYWPGGFKKPVNDQLHNIINVLRADMTGGNRMNFRIIPRDAVLPPHVYDDTFCLYQTPGGITGFKEPWGYRNALHLVEGETLAELGSSWQQIGAVALDRHDSLNLLEHIAQDWR